MCGVVPALPKTSAWLCPYPCSCLPSPSCDESGACIWISERRKHFLILPFSLPLSHALPLLLLFLLLQARRNEIGSFQWQHLTAYFDVLLVYEVACSEASCTQHSLRSWGMRYDKDETKGDRKCGYQLVRDKVGEVFPRCWDTFIIVQMWWNRCHC